MLGCLGGSEVNSPHFTTSSTLAERNVFTDLIGSSESAGRYVDFYANIVIGV